MLLPTAASLRPLLDRLIDYAGMFPPAGLDWELAAGNYCLSSATGVGWMLRWLVVSAADLPQIPTHLNGSLAVLTDADEPRASVIETKKIVRASRPVYCELPIADLGEV